jgi:hypothetical protein
MTAAFSICEIMPRMPTAVPAALYPELVFPALLITSMSVLGAPFRLIRACSRVAGPSGSPYLATLRLALLDDAQAGTKSRVFASSERRAPTAV